MTYAVGGLIQATDINGFVSTGTPNFNNIWATGSGNSGYGQTALATVAVGDKVAQSPWNPLVTNIAKSASHQGTTITAVTPPVTNDKIAFISALSTNLTAINTARLNAASQGGTTSTSTTTTITWSNLLTFTMTATFSSANAARYFFNAGGQLSITTSHPAGSVFNINQFISDLCSDAGTTWLSSPTSGTATLAGTPYSGVTKVGGANPGGSTISTNSGYYAIGGGTQIARQTSDFVYRTYGIGSFLSITAAASGSTVTFTVVIDEVPNGAVVSTGTICTLTARAPSTSQLTNSWGTPTLSGSFTAS